MSENSTLLSAIGNRIAATDLVKSQTITFPFEASINLSRLDASPDGHFLIAVDDASCMYYVNLRRRVLLHSMML